MLRVARRGCCGVEKRKILTTGDYIHMVQGLLRLKIAFNIGHIFVKSDREL